MQEWGRLRQSRRLSTATCAMATHQPLRRPQQHKFVLAQTSSPKPTHRVVEPCGGFAQLLLPAALLPSLPLLAPPAPLLRPPTLCCCTCICRCHCRWHRLGAADIDASRHKEGFPSFPPDAASERQYVSSRRKLAGGKALIDGHLSQGRRGAGWVGSTAECLAKRSGFAIVQQNLLVPLQKASQQLCPAHRLTESST